MTHPEALREGIERASGDWGPVTGIVHGVGNLADKKIEQKTERDFAVVFEPKVLGLKHLLDLVDPDRLDHLALFSSVSGYFGNPGQADYALANEVLNKAAHALQRRHPHCHVVAMNWGPWDAGMVGPELKRAYAQRGVDLIPVEEGTRLMVEELGRGPGAAQVLFAGAMSRATDVASGAARRRTCRDPPPALRRGQPLRRGPRDRVQPRAPGDVRPFLDGRGVRGDPPGVRLFREPRL